MALFNKGLIGNMEYYDVTCYPQTIITNEIGDNAIRIMRGLDDSQGKYLV